MKQLIKVLFILFFFSLPLLAQTTAAYFTETGKGAVYAYNQAGYVYGVTTATAPGDTAYYVLSYPFGTSATAVRNSFMGSKVIVGINISVAFTDVVATLVLQVSPDNSNWYDLATLDADTTPNVTGVQLYLADFTSTACPYARLKFNASGLTIHTTGRVAFLYALPR